MSGLFRSPKPPDPTKTANAQFALNQRTAQEQQRLAMTGQTNTTGSLNYVADASSPSGYRAVSSLNPELQRQYNTVLEGLNTPVSENVDTRLMSLGRSRLDPIFAERGATLESDLINRGIRPGSDAYASAHDAFGRERTDAYNQLLLQGRGQALNEANAPLQRYLSLVGGGNPQFGQTPSPGVAPVDYTGLVGQQYQAQAQNQAAKLGGLAGAAGTALGGWAFGGFPGAAAAGRLIMGGGR